MKRTSQFLPVIFAAAWLAVPAFSQSQSQSNTQPPPAAPPASQNDSQAGKININEPPPPPPDPSAAKGPEAAKAKPVFDPLGAEKDLEVGNFYFKRGNYDAAIERYQDATRKHVGYAKPYLLLGEAFDKKDDAEDALKAYREYVHLYPESPDRKRVDARIAELEKKVPQETKKAPGQ